MANTIPTTQGLNDQIVERFETKLNQDVPDMPFSFTKLLSANMAISIKPLYTYADSLKKQNLVLTADRESLIEIGNNYGVPIRPASTTEITVYLSATAVATLPQTAVFKNALDLYYFPKITQPLGIGDNTVILVGEKSGTEYNVEIDDELSLEYAITGVVSSAEVASIITYGTDEEATDEYRRRLLSEIGTIGGGGNNVDYRRWAEAVEGVYRAFPYAGDPYDPIGSDPSKINVYIESLYNDGVADNELLIKVKNEILADPDTGESRPPIDHVSANITVSSINRVYFTVNIHDLNIDIGAKNEAKAKVETAIEDHLRMITPFIVGVDREYERSDKVSSVSISKIVESVLEQFGGGANKIEVFEDDAIIKVRTLIGGDIARLQNVVWYYGF